MNTGYVIILITAPSKETGRTIARYLIENKLAACVNILDPIESIYTWEGAVQQEEEVLLIAKSRADLVDSLLIDAVKTVHPYQVPEIIALPIVTGSHSYLDWISSVTRNHG